MKFSSEIVMDTSGGRKAMAGRAMNAGVGVDDG